MVSKNNSNVPTGNNGLGVNFLPDFYQTPANKKFLQSTIDQLYQPGTVTKTSGFIGRKNAKAAINTDVYVQAADQTRQNYQLEPGLVIKDTVGNVKFFKDYIDYINQINVFGGNTSNHPRLNAQEFYSWDPHFDWDKFSNFQNYYWLPYGPSTIKIYGQQGAISSTYTVVIQNEQGTNEYLFTPNGLDLNPTIKLYRGQTYNFNITSNNNPFSIMATRTIGSSNRYATGVTNNGIESGILTFTVPADAPSLLYYQSETDINLGGAIEIFDVVEASTLNVETDILGKQKYTLHDGTSLSNGMKVAFGGNVIPASYATGQYYVEGVGTAIKLSAESMLEIISPYTTDLSIQFDQTPFDIEPFDDATGYASIQDYVVINRASRDHNPWSRYNRWFHKDVITVSALYNNDVPTIDQAARAIRPIIEFEADLKLFNLGTTAIFDINLVDNFTTDVFSNIEGSLGYNIDGVPLSNGQRILFTADTDPLVQNKIYQVEFINIRGRNQIHLIEVATPTINQVTLVLEGKKNQSQMYWFNGTTWIQGQQKTKTNQAPLFDIVDDNGISYSNTSVYNGSTFGGTKLFSYKVGNGVADTALGFPLSYLNVSNIGDIVFNFNLGTDSFEYKENNTVNTKTINTGYLVSHDYVGNPRYVNGWQTCAADTVQAAVRIYTNSNLTNNFNIDIFDVTPSEFHLDQDDVRVYINDNRVAIDHWTLVNTSSHYQVVFAIPVILTDIITIKVYSETPINSNGYYEIPINLQNNPLNDTVETFTLGEVRDHVNSIIDNIYNPEMGNDATDIDNLPYDKNSNDIKGVTFIGTFPGTSNLRDLGNITQYGTKFVQHSGPLSLSLYHITSESNNIIRATETARDDYNSFKRNFITIASSLGVDADPITLVDLTLQKINANRPNTAPYYFSDMVPYGAAVTTNLIVVDHRIKTYPLSTVFNLTSLSNKAVLVYQTSNSVKTQLIYGRDYTFSDQATVVIDNSVALLTGDTITTVEYDSTDGCFVPQTPTKLGIWPAYIPQIYLDSTLLYSPQYMIQGHDGSVILSYGDYRDAMLLELETRIYNNIKVKYDPSIFDISSVVPGYNRHTDYSLAEFNQVLAPTFYKWTGLVGVDFTQPLTYDSYNTFTYNYSADVMPNGIPALGYWRGIYRYMLDTDRPNLCPWEMLGFSVEPTWWTSVYGPAPYTSDNLVMWEDLSTGTVREPGMPLVVLSQYIRPFLLNHIPVDEAGNLISPLNSGLATGTFSPSVDNNFVFGDISPVESAWRRSSYYPFSVLIASMLLTPAKTFGVLLDRSRIVRNVAGQLIYKDTGLRIRPEDVAVPSIYSSTSRIQTAGIVNYVVDLILNVIFSNNLESYNSYKTDLNFLTSQLSYRVGAFTNQPQFNLLLESKTPLATGSVFIPTESYNIFLNTSSPVKKLTYSGVIITKISSGFEIKGYSKSQPYFKYYSYLESGISINVGGISEEFVVWTPGQQYIIGQVVQYGNTYYRATANITAGSSLDTTTFVSLNQLPIVGGVTAQFRKSWDRSLINSAPYGTTFTTIQEVIDFMLGYEQWLIDQGFVFDSFNNNLGVVANWSTSAKEFMFWTTQNWSSSQDKWGEWLPNQEYTYSTIVKFNGSYYSAIYNIPPSDVFEITQWELLPGLSNIGSSVISLSPAAGGITFNTNLTVVDSIANSFNDYEMFKVDGSPIPISQLSSYRNGNTVTYVSGNSEGLYCASFYLIQNEHVVLINNVDIFNDVIYNPPTGYRRDRIKLSGYITTGWYGGLDIPGFIFDSAIVEAWQPWKDYNMADIVLYQGYYYSARAFTAGTSIFIAADWIQLKEKPTPKILPNWTNAATQFTDFYSLEVDSFDTAQQTMAHHLVGYQQRQYLNNIIQDSVSEFKFYQGMIREKGTQNVLNQLFGVLSSDAVESLTFYEEWALRVGQYGAANAFEDIEIVLDASVVKNNPQGYLLSPRIDSSVSPFIIQQTPNDIYVKPLGYNSNPFPALVNSTPLLRGAGYVDPADVIFSLGYISDITKQDVTKLSNGQYVWCAFDGPSWNIYRFTDLLIRATNVTYDGTTLTVTTQNIVPIVAGSYVGLAQSESFDGFYQVATVTLNSFTITVSNLTVAQPFTSYNELIIYSLITQRTISLDTLDTLKLTHLTPGSLIWVDDNGSGQWANYKYSPVYKQHALTNPTPTAGFTFGSTIAVNSQNSVMTVGNSQGSLYVYDKVGKSVAWERRGAIPIPFLSTNYFLTSQPSLYATVVAISADGTWLVSGSPLAGYIKTNYQGVWSTGIDYVLNNVVLYNNVYYQSLQDSYNQTPTTVSLYWKIIPYIAVDKITGDESNAHVGQGVISIYKKDINNDYSLVDSIVSPVPTANENFGSQMVFGNNVLYVSALGYSNNKGNVYKLSYKTTVEQNTTYNPVGSSAGTLVVTSTSGIRAGMIVQGSGFTSGQIVEGVLTKITFASSANIGRVASGMTVSGTNILPGTLVVSKGSDNLGNNYIIVRSSQDMNTNISSVEFNGNPLLTFIATNVASMNTLLLSGSPDSTPAGVLTFVSNSWTYDFSETYVGAATGSNFGSSLVLSQDGNTFAIASSNSTLSGVVNVYKNSGLGLTAYQTLIGTTTGFGRSISISNYGDFLAISDDHTSAGTINQQGSVVVYSNSSTGYIVLQSLVNHYPESSGLFGNKIAFMNDDNTIAVYSKYGDVSISTSFDSYTELLYYSNNAPQTLVNELIIGTEYKITSLGNLSQDQWNIIATSTPITAASIGTSYKILSLGNTDWNSVGATYCTFTATSILWSPTDTVSNLINVNSLISGQLIVGQVISGIGIPLGTTIINVNNSNIYLSSSISAIPTNSPITITASLLYAVGSEIRVSTFGTGTGVVVAPNYTYAVGSYFVAKTTGTGTGTAELANYVFQNNLNSTVISPTTFDKSSTNFITLESDNGKVDIYDRYNSKWVFSESLTSTNQQGDAYGTGFAVADNQIFVSAINALDQNLKSGQVYSYEKLSGTYSWESSRTEVLAADVSKVKKTFLYNRALGKLVTYLDVIDPLQGKIAGPAQEEIQYQTFYDPASYSYSDGTVSATVNTKSFWTTQTVGQLWWNLTTTKFVENHFDDPSYRNNTWNTLAPGASVDIYEWVSYNQLPAVWDSKADTPAGIAAGISGTSLYGNSAYCLTQTYDNISKTFSNTYYFWVKNKKIIPSNVNRRNMSASDVASIIASPRGQGYTCLALTSTNSFSLVNAAQYLKDKDVVLAIEYWLTDKTDQNTHSQWKLISNDAIVDLPTTIEQKWFDSLCGIDQGGRAVPDPTLPVKLRYGIENRPRQGMFVNRIEALKEFIERVNTTLISYQITESRNISALESYDPAPTTISGLYDKTIDTDAELVYVNAVPFSPPTLSPIIVNGKITGINIINPGNGYVIAPYITITGTGEGAVVKSTINAVGKIIGATIVNGGEGYDNTTQCSVRSYSVLVLSDSTSQNSWSIYSYDLTTKLWSKTLTQSYDVRNYWSYTDWYAAGYSQFLSADYAVSTFVELNSISSKIGQLVKVLTANKGGWLLLEKYSDSTSVDWTQSYNVVGIQNGTIQFSKALYAFKGTEVGYDASIFDGVDFDIEATRELRIILNAIKNNILIDDLKTAYLDLFFSSIRYAHSEQPFIDWIFKTSFVRATHNVGSLSQPVNYPSDNLNNFQDYVAEVKPYRTKLREYISDYTSLDIGQAAVTDFDLQSNYENGFITAIGVEYKNNSIQSFDQSLNSYPWKFWNDNLGFIVTDIKITDGGSGYANPPQVVISQPTGPNSTTAIATAYIANGKVNRIRIVSNGSAYLSAPTVIFNGGLSTTGTAAKAVAIIGDSVVRANRTALKFDRVNQTYYISNLEHTDTFTGSGSRLQFSLTWAPDVQVSSAVVTVNGEIILRELYKLAVVSSTSAGYTQYSGTIIFNSAPAKNSTITVAYKKDISILNATDRIQYYYNPTSGQLGKDLSQLMTGIDYGGTIVSGLGFNLGGGWGVTPYYSESWDNRDPSFNDYVVQVTANTHSFTLPYVPAANTEINIYQVKNHTISYTSDGSTLGYAFDINLISPTVNVTSTSTAVDISSAYNPTGSVGYILKVASTAGVVPGMVISGTGFNSRQKVVRIVDSTTLNISPVPDSTPSGTLTFSNTAGGFILTVASVSGLKIGDIVTSTGSIFSYGTIINSIDSTNNCLTLNQIMLTHVANGTTINFAQQLVQPTDVIINANGTILLTSPAPVSATINISGSYRPVRLDDPHYGTPSQTNASAIVITPVADGISSTFTIPGSYTVNDGDEFILRQSTSEGSINPASTDYDTAIDGGNLAYSTASGLAADDIVLDGDGLITPTSSPAPEEVVPGQVVDTLAIKVYDQAQSGSADIKIDNQVADGITNTFAIGQLPNSSRAVIVKLGTVIKTYTTDYTIDYTNKLVVFNSVPSAGQTVSIFSIGFNGSNILDIDYFVGDGETTEFVTKATWVSSVTSLIYVNGVVASPTLFKTDNSYAFANAIGLKFAVAPAAGALINFIIVSGSQQTFAITKTETVPTNGATTYTLQYPIGKTLPNESNMIVRVDQSILQAPTNSYFTIGKNRLTYTVDSTKAVPYSVPTNNILVYAGGNLLTLGVDYTVDPSAISVKINKIVYSTYSGQKLIVSIIPNDGYSYNETTGQITFAQAYNNTHTVEVVSSYLQDILDIQRTNIEYVSSFTLTPGTTEFYTYNAVSGGIIKLDRPVIDNNYVWVVQGTTLLTPSIDYKLNDDLQSIVLANPPQSGVVTSIITFGSNILPNAGISYMQFKDMLNRVSYKRLNANKRTMLVNDLKWNDTEIFVDDASTLDVPNPTGNRPGIIEIRGERIEYFTINGNALGQLRRGTLGTGVYNLNKAGTYVQGIGASETIPYTDTTTTETITASSGTSVNLGFIPADANSIEVFVGGYNDTAEWAANTAYSVGTIVRVGPYTYRCVTENVSSTIFATDSSHWAFFVGNIRLKKSAYSVFNINQAPYSPAGDVSFPADFTVDGTTAKITLTNPLSFGTQVTVIKQTGTAWDSATNILNDRTAIGNFIKAEPGIWYTEYKQ